MESEQRVHRRQLLAWGLGTLLGGLGCRASGCRPTPQRVLIIGAGAAGLAAGQALRQLGHQVEIIEARRRIGGRVHTDLSMNTPIDLGAMLLHGIHHNPLTPILQRLKQPLTKVDYHSVHVTKHTTERPSPRDVAQVIRLFRRGLKELPNIKGAVSQLSLDEAFQLWLQSQPKDKHAHLEQLMSQWVLPTFGMKEGAALSDVAMLGWADADCCTGGDHLLPNSYKPLIDELGKGLKIHLSQPVKQISYDNKGVTIVGHKRTWTGDRAIITVPLGVLQRETIAFTPSLPGFKKEAIRALGMGLLNKVVLRFDRCYWPKDAQFLGYQGKRNGEFPLWVNYARHTGAPILMGVAGGPYGTSMERLTDRQIIAQSLDILRRCCGRNLPKPTQHLITRWKRDPFACGSYSHVPVGSDAEAYDAMAQPIEDKLFFAGEATYRDYPTTVHGAYLSGLREAKRSCFT